MTTACEGCDKEVARLRAELDRAERLRRLSVETNESLRAELEELRLTAYVRGRGCQCGDDDACAIARERDQARAELAALRAAPDVPEDVREMLRADGWVAIAWGCQSKATWSVRWGSGAGVVEWRYDLATLAAVWDAIRAHERGR